MKKHNLNFLVSDYQRKGFNKTQATSLAWAEFFETKMADIEYRYQGNVDSTIRIDTYCNDCSEGGQFLPSTVISFINHHKDHSTKTIKLR